MATERIYLGKSHIWGGVSLSKHSWDCGWYWGFGYVGNSKCHFHIESMIRPPADKYEPNWTDVSRHFESTWLTQEQWWILRDLFISAYALKGAAAAYQFGGHQTGKAEPYRVINAERATEINADLETLLNYIWRFLTEARAAYQKDG